VIAGVSLTPVSGGDFLLLAVILPWAGMRRLMAPPMQ
jgi:hypothetical protein